MAIIVPNTGSTTTIGASFSGCTVGGQPRWTWLGLATAGASGCVLWMIGPSATGSPFLPIALSPLTTKLFGPFMSSCIGWAAASVSGGSAIIHQRM